MNPLNVAFAKALHDLKINGSLLSYQTGLFSEGINLSIKFVKPKDVMEIAYEMQSLGAQHDMPQPVVVEKKSCEV